MATIYLTTGDALAVIHSQEGSWQVDLQLRGLPAYCIAVDPSAHERLYCGTLTDGLWRSSDGGASWRPAGEGVSYSEVMAVAVSPLTGAVWAGTEPSALFCSEDGGETWQERPTLRDLPSAPTWSFPPRPWTHHVRWIEPDPCVRERIFVGIELGGVMRSLDGGLTWEDRKPEGQHDAHTMRSHRLAPGRVYEAAGGGYAESLDGGESWRRDDTGLRHHYLFGLAVDPADPETVVVSASRGPQQAHSAPHAEATIYRKSAGQPWQEVREGLPNTRGTRIYALASNGSEPGVFYAATHGGNVYRSPDAGLSWEQLDIGWPDGYRPNSAHPCALVVVD
ncbi:MAG TPA: hypothetical protein VEX13_00340 [Chloroflexia bacterium]|nr:hypothetical protein [Chloroflexia bacterium]